MIEISAQRIILAGRIPSKKNSKRVFRSGGRTVVASSRNHNIWHRKAFFEIKEQKARPMTGPLSVKMTFWLPDNRKSDLTNKAESVMDLLVDAGIIEDDNVKICPKITLEFAGVDTKNARVEILLEKA